MSRWSDIAEWRGPTVNQGGAAVEQRGLVIHIAEGSYEGTIAWQRNAAAQVSSHFVVAKDGRIAQLVDTATTAWTQRAGNGRWLSVENEGYSTGPLTDAQVEANARLFARGHRDLGWPLQLATSPSGRGLGHHSMGAESGVDWGHSECPGKAIKAQKAAILARAVQLVGGAAPIEEDDMELGKEWDGSYLIKRIESLVRMDPTYTVTLPDKTTRTEDNALVKAVLALQAPAPVQVDASAVAAALASNAAFLTALAKAVNDDLHARTAS